MEALVTVLPSVQCDAAHSFVLMLQMRVPA
jgi:hypothetical protein